MYKIACSYTRNARDHARMVKCSQTPAFASIGQFRARTAFRAGNMVRTRSKIMTSSKTSRRRFWEFRFENIGTYRVFSGSHASSCLSPSDPKDLRMNFWLQKFSSRILVSQGLGKSIPIFGLESPGEATLPGRSGNPDLKIGESFPLSEGNFPTGSAKVEYGESGPRTPRGLKPLFTRLS